MIAAPIIHILILLGGLQGVLIGLLHASRLSIFRGSRFLGWALAVHALSDVYLWLYWTKMPFDLRILILLPLNLVLLPVYLLFRYVQAFTGDQRAGGRFALFLGIAASLELVIYLMPAGAALYTGMIDRPVLGFAKAIRNTLTLGSLPIVAGTCLVMYRMIRRYRLAKGTLPGYRERVSWLYQLFIGLCLVYSLAQLPMLVMLLSGKLSRVWFYPLGIGSSMFLAWACIRAFIIHERIRVNNVSDQDSSPPLPLAQVNIYEQAIQLIQAEKLYRQSDLKLADVAARLAVSPHYLSRIVNQQAKKNFTDLVNEYRIGDVARMMHDPAYSHYTLEGLGREAGFGAKSTYQASFKRLTGLTPSQYRASHRPVS